MSISKNRRGVQDIRTAAGRLTDANSRHKAYLRLCTLEMERERRDRERAVAAQQAQVAASRVAALETQIAELLAAIGNGPAATRGALEPKPSGPSSAVESIELRY